jgi:hypothetical protein
MQRFWDKVDTTGDCWEWQGATRPTGYGVFKLKGKTVQAHRQAYTLVKGPIPVGKLVLHTCDNRECCNPDHLFIGDHLANTHDMMSKGRHPHKETNGRSKLTMANVLEARVEYAAGEVTIAALAKNYGVTRQALGNAIKGRSW